MPFKLLKINPQPKDKVWRSQKYLNFVKTLPPLIPGQGQTVYHHIRIDGNAGTGMKPSDFYAVPLPKLVHDAFHAGQESDREFWIRHDIDIYRELFNIIRLWIKH